MQELVAAINTKVDEDFDTTSDFSEAAAKWAAHCIRRLTGDQLDRGLAVAKAMAYFEDGLLHPED